MFQANEPAKPSDSGPPCAVCGGEFCRDCWGSPVCARCAVNWADSMECHKVQAELDPIPLWQRARADPARAFHRPEYQNPPEPSREMRDAAYKRAVSAWVQRVKREVAA